jgi:predicted pyridoxine 5'-phosphate oxidase superfamily flavin-nucleotide-binding protein
MIPDEVAHFFLSQGCVIVSTLDESGYPHNSCKGIIRLDRKGTVYLLDVYKQKTFANLKVSPLISITAVDEHNFRGYSLKGEAKIVQKKGLDPEIIKAWEERITGRITQRLIKNIHEEKGHLRHPEVLLPQPEYLIVMQVKEIIDLTPHHIKRGA